MQHKVLFLAPVFYNYYQVIAEEIRRKGYELDIFLFPSSFLYKLIDNFSALRGVKKLYIDCYFAFLKKKLGKKYEKILVIKGSVVPTFFYDYLKERYPTTSYILYIWDDVKLDQQELSVAHYFDLKYTYNKTDAEKYGFIYRPMFYVPFPNIDSVVKDTDVFYIASYREGRFSFSRKISELMKSYGMKMNVYLRVGMISQIFISKRREYKSWFHSKNMPYLRMMEVLASSKICVELCRPGQQGLSTRPFEALATNTKVITTNADIINYDFYNSNNVIVVEEQNPIIPKSWVLAPYESIPENIKKRYSLSTFVNELLSI